MSTDGFALRSPLQGRRRALVKTVLYRAVMVLVTVGVALAVTGDVAAAINIGLAANVVKTATYFAYERAWDRIAWGVGDV